jgi:transcriptional regulator with XRE-family HTH domain
MDDRSLAQLLRAARGTGSKYRVAKATGVAHSNLRGMEAGTRFPSERTLKALCDFYGLDFDAVILISARDKLRRAGGGS